MIDRPGMGFWFGFCPLRHHGDDSTAPQRTKESSVSLPGGHQPNTYWPRPHPLGCST
jgi:hypothetical protein